MSTQVVPQTWTVDELTTKQQDGTLVLSAAALAAQELADVLSALGPNQLALQGVPVKTPTPQTVSVECTTTLFGFPDVDALVTFEVASRALSVSLTATFTDGGIQILGMPWAAITDLALDLKVVGPSLPVPFVSGDLRGSIQLENVKDPITVTLGPAFGDGWLLQASDIPLSALGDLLAGHADPGSLVPSSLGLDGLSIVDLSCRFDPTSWDVRSVNATLGTPAGAPAKVWSFANDDFPELSGVGVSVGIDFDDTAGGPNGGPSVTVTAGATVGFPKLKPPLKLPVQVVREPTRWRVGILGASGFPSVGDLVGSATDASMLPAGIATLQLASASLELTLGSGDPTPQSFFVAAALEEWTLVTGLSLENVALQVFVDRTAGDASGFLTGAVRFGDVVEVPVAIEKPGGSAPWTLRLATEAPPALANASALSTVVGGDHVGTHLPSSFPATLPVTLKDLTVAFDATSHAVTEVTVDIESDGPWPLPLPGSSSVEVSGLALQLQVGWPGTNVTGSIGGTFDVDGTKIAVSAGRSDPAGDWTITGGLAAGSSVKLGAVADKLGGFAVPPALSDAALTILQITFDKSGDFTFHAEGALSADNSKSPTLALDADVTQAGATFSGSLTIGKAQFKFTAVKGDKSQTRFLAAYTDTGGDSISVRDLVAAVSPDAAAETPDIEVELKDVIFAMAAGDPSPRFLFAFDLKRIELSALPLVGAKLADSASVDDLQVVAATATPVAAAGSDPGDVAAWNALLPHPATKLPSDGIVRGVLMSAKLQLGNDSVAVALAPPAPLPTTKKPSDTPAAAADSTKWFPVQRAFGPVYFNRVGARYDAGALWLLLDASLAFDGLSLTLDGLGVGSELTAFDPKFHLDGIGISYQQDPVEIAGAFLAVPSAQLGNATFEYDGAAVVRAEDFTLAAIGSYAEVAGHPSLFVFAEFAHALGGPPAAYVTALMGGFGYNRALRIPAQDEVSQFPFVHGLDAGAPGDGTPIGVLKVLEGDGKSQATPWLTDSLGDNWLAVGVRFTSFELAETYALLIAEFGNELQFALVGLTTLRLPQDTSEKAFAYVELEVEAVLKPRDGFFGLTAVLSPNSFVFAARVPHHGRLRVLRLVRRRPRRRLRRHARRLPPGIRASGVVSAGTATRADVAGERPRHNRRQRVLRAHSDLRDGRRRTARALPRREPAGVAHRVGRLPHLVGAVSLHGQRRRLGGCLLSRRLGVRPEDILDRARRAAVARRAADTRSCLHLLVGDLVLDRVRRPVELDGLGQGVGRLREAASGQGRSVQGRDPVRPASRLNEGRHGRPRGCSPDRDRVRRARDAAQAGDRERRVR